MKSEPIHIIPTGKLIAMVGNPNCGKTATFNALTGSHQKVANYAGVTVDKIEGRLLHAHEKIRVMDLPGAYSLQPRSPDEKITVDILTGKVIGEKRPDLTVCVCDATNLRRSLKIVLDTIRLGRPCIVLINMMDRAKKLGIQIDITALEKRLGVPVFATVATHQLGHDQVFECLHDPKRWPSCVAPQSVLNDPRSVRECIKSLLMDLKLNSIFHDELTEKTDRIILHPIWGPIILLTVLFVLFQAVFSFAQYPMQWVEALFTMAGDVTREYLPQGWVQDLIVDAVIGGVGGVLVFLPQLLILFFFILIMEECGYLPRAAYLLDRMMGEVGLSGRSFVPLLSGFACAVPAILATRSISHPIDRWITMSIVPLLTCSARLPVYTVMISAFIPDQPIGPLNLQGLVLFSLYIIGTFGALLIAWVLKHFVKHAERAPLMMELPSYHIPQAKNIALGLWQRTKSFLQKIAGIILGLTVVIWILTTYPAAPAGATGAAIEYSLAGIIGQAIAPWFEPIGFNWQMCVAMIPAFGAREVAVSALATVYAVSGNSESTLIPAIRSMWSTPMGLSMLAFFVFSPSCLATFATIRHEAKSGLVAPALMFGYLLLAYVFAFAVYHLALYLNL